MVTITFQPIIRHLKRYKIDYLFLYFIYSTSSTMKRVQNIHERSETTLDGFLLKQQAMTNQLGSSKQDHAAFGSYTGSNGIRVAWTLVADGHSRDTAIEVIRLADLNTIMQEDEPWRQLQKIIDEACNHLLGDAKFKSGATCVYAKVEFHPMETVVKITNIGDSSAVLIVNGAPYFVSTPHDVYNGSEMVRLIQEGRVDTDMPIIAKDMNFETITDKLIHSVGGKYVNFQLPSGQELLLAMTQSLGHMGISGFKPDTTTIRLKKSDTFKLFCVTDGVTDVLPTDHRAISLYQTASSTEEIIRSAEAKWKQEWHCVENFDMRNPHVCKFPANGYDDCGCAFMEWSQSQAVPEIPPIPYNDYGEYENDTHHISENMPDTDANN
jgi:serine/threonine protein phosphatase PrpC